MYRGEARNRAGLGSLPQPQGGCCRSWAAAGKAGGSRPGLGWCKCGHVLWGLVEPALGGHQPGPGCWGWGSCLTGAGSLGTGSSQRPCLPGYPPIPYLLAALSMAGHCVIYGSYLPCLLGQAGPYLCWDTGREGGITAKQLRQSPCLDLPRCCAALSPPNPEGLAIASPAPTPGSTEPSAPVSSSPSASGPASTFCPPGEAVLGDAHRAAVAGPWGRASRVPGGGGCPILPGPHPRLAQMWVRGQEEAAKE